MSNSNPEIFRAKYGYLEIIDGNVQKSRSSTPVSGLTNYNRISNFERSFEHSDEQVYLLNQWKTSLGLKLSSQFPYTKKSILRFYILFLFSGFAFFQGLIWNTWGPIADSAEVVYNWDKGGSVIALLANWGPIAFIPGAIIFPFVINKFGLRYGLLLAMGMVWVGSFIRCFTTEFPLATYIMHVAHFLNGLAGPVSMGATTTVSANWFPYNERTFATSVSGMSNYFGICISFIIGPLIVNDVTFIGNSSNVSSSELRKLTSQTYIMLYIIAAFCTLLFLLIIVYYPSKPKYPPSVTATIVRSRTLESIKSLLRNIPFWLLCLVYGLVTGVNSAWSSYLYPNLSKLPSIHVTEKSVGWLGFYMSLAGVVTGILISFLSDYLSKRKKLILLVFLIIATIFGSLFTFICEGIVRPGSITYASLIISSIISNSAVVATVGIFYELSAEIAYPVPEATATIILTLMNNLVGMVFLAFASFPQLGTSWMNWTTVASYLIAVPIILFTPIHYDRLNTDTTQRKF